MKKYAPKETEKTAREVWTKNPDIFRAPENPREGRKKYILDMFPYPSGAGLHVGHVESYTATDIYSRYLRMKGFDVLHPQGFDAFGLPAENYAVKTGIHPKTTTEKAVATFKKQMTALGLAYDWSREVNSSRPEYYQWTQWFFLLLYKNKMACRKKAKVNWCPKCQTVLANEQAEGGKCERCETEVIQKDLEQWFFKITDFAEDLIEDLGKVDWPESTKAAQKNWIGRSEGAQFKMPIVGSDLFIEVYTTRLDTAYGITYAVVAPEHEILFRMRDQGSIENWDEVKKYLEGARKKTDLERMEAKVKTGVELKGIKVVNPFNNEKIPLYVADYVLSHYGTGAVMAVPAHDERDREFAKKYKLPVKEVIKSRSLQTAEKSKEIYTEDGILNNSGGYNELTSEEAREKMTAWLEKNKLGRRKVNYKLRDWLVSRQRYWGAPIPIIYCEKCGEAPVPENDLPVLLPDDVDFLPTGESPLKYSRSFQNVKCPVCGAPARRESDTMDTFVCSSWYYLRYADPKNEKEFASRENLKKWLPADLYVGGAEHTVLHLLYSRFFVKVLKKLGYVDFDEPFLKLRHQGTILAEDGNKMSKSKGNVINPDEVVGEYGADALRCFEMFMGPLEDAKPWQTKGIIGIRRFLERVYNLNSKFQIPDSEKISNLKIQILIQKTVKKIGEDIEKLKFNTAISALMILLNEMEKEKELPVADYEKLVILVSPFAPHLAETLWQKLGHKESIFRESWPNYDPEMVKDEEVELVIQVNGKVRERMKVPADISEEEAKERTLKSEKIKTFIADKKIKRTVFVRGKLINLVV